MNNVISILTSIVQATDPINRGIPVTSSSRGVRGPSPGIPQSIIASIVAVPLPANVADLTAALRAFLSADMDLLACIRCSWFSQKDVRVSISGWKDGNILDLSTSLNIIVGRNLRGAARAQWESENQFRTIIRGWYHDDKDLLSFIQPYVETDLVAVLNTTQPVDLLSYIRVWPYRILQSSIYGWATIDLVASITKREDSFLSVNIGGHYPANLNTIIRAWYVGNYSSFKTSIVVQHIFDLSASLNFFCKGCTNLNASLLCRPIYLLNASIVGWAERNLSATLNASIPKWYLPATIVAHGKYRNLGLNIFGGLGVENIKDLYATISGWVNVNLNSSIFSINYVSLLASIVSIGGTKDLVASIKVKEIIFNEFYKFSTVNTSDLRAYVGFSLCSIRTPRSAYTSLLASLVSIPTYDLGATIEGIKVSFSGSKNLGVFISYTNKYSMMSKFLSFKMSTSVSDVIRSTPSFFKNSLNITFKIINGQVDLKTLITSQPHNASLGAIIRSRLLIIHGTGTDKVLTEQLVEIEGYRKIWSEYIDVYLRTEKPIYYSSGHVFSVNYGDPIISFLFKRYSSNGIQHEYFLDQNMYFDSTDSAIRYGFSKISSRASLVYLSATIYPVVKSLKLNAKINGEEKMILYLNFPFTYLKSGSLSFMGTCINNTSYKSKTSVFGGIQDITSSISATPN